MVELCCTSRAGSGDATSYTSDEKPRRENLLIILHAVQAISSRESATPASLTPRCYADLSHFRWFLSIWRCEDWWKVLKVPGELALLAVRCCYGYAFQSCGTLALHKWRSGNHYIPMEIPWRRCQCQQFMWWNNLPPPAPPPKQCGVPRLRQALKPLTGLIYRDEKGDLRF